MCVILATLGNAVPSREELETGCYNNPDGFGWGIVVDTDNGPILITDKSMDEKYAIDSFFETLAEHGKNVTASAFHARITTHGKSTIENCHPWQIGNDELSVMFHNGILDVDMTNAKGRSDSGVFANDLLPLVGGAAGAQNNFVAELLTDFTIGSKLVILTADPKLFPMTIIGEDRGQWRGEHWYSNTSCWFERFKIYTNTGYVSSFGKYTSPYAAQKANMPEPELPMHDEDVSTEEELFDIWICGECEEETPWYKDSCHNCLVCFTCNMWDCTCVYTS